MDALATVKLGKHFQVTATGLVITGSPSFESCDQLWQTLLTMEKTIQFSIGDAWRYFEDQFGERASQIVSDHTGWSLSTLRNYRWVAEQVAPSVRRLDKLSFSHHQKVACHPPRDQAKWLNKAADGDDRDGVQTAWTVTRMDKAIKAGEDPPVSAWYCLVRAKNEHDRDTLMKELEGRGYTCKATERRGDK